jgi:replicative DNA helicase
VADHGIQVNIGDYIQLMTDYGTGFMNREQKVSEMSAAGKIAAKEHDLTNIWLSQLSRQVENRGGSKRPLLSDLRESGAIEQDADVVTFIYRAEYYNEMTDEDGKSTRGVAELINAKNRNGDICKSVVAFQDYSVRFMDMSEYNTINGRASRPAIDTWSQE